MKSAYFDYNLFNHLQIALDAIPHESTNEKQVKDYKSLLNIWEYHNNSEIDLITCEDDSLMEFANFNKSICNYNDIEPFLQNKPRMLRRFLLFKQVSKGKLLICPFGEYGYGRGPYGGGEEKHDALLEKIRVMLNKTSPQNAQKDRDARHIMHSVLYDCDFFVTIDYKLITNFQRRYALIESYMKTNNYKLNITNPTKLLELQQIL